MSPTIVICGAGGIGRATALILACNPAMNPRIYIGDINSQSLGEAMKWIIGGKNRDIDVKTFLMPLRDSNEEMEDLFQAADVILDCLPGSQAPRIAALALKFKAHYANLTEYVKETEDIKQMVKTASTGFLLQTGLAPGYINVLGCALYDKFKDLYGQEKLASMQMRVGALSESVTAPSYYAYTWSRIGVATEYVKDTIVLRGGEILTVPSLSAKQNIIIDGELLEENYTSGGVANLPEAFVGRVDNLDYKTLRYPGHYDWVARSLEELDVEESLSKALDAHMQQYVPTVENDRIVIYVAVAGKDKSGVLRSIDKSFNILPAMIGSKKLRAIQLTTASSLCEAAYYLVNRNLKGAILQSDIIPEEFLNGPYVSEVYGEYLQ